MDSAIEAFGAARASWDALCVSIDGVATPAFVERTMSSAASLAGVTQPEIRLFTCLLAAYPLAALWRALPGANMKHVMSVLVGWWMLQFVIGYQWLHCIIPCIMVYAAMALFGPKSRYITFGIALGYLTGGHLYRMYTDYLGWTLDWTMQMMVITQKLSAFGFNYYDGNSPSASQEQKTRGFTKLPSLLEFLSFILFPGNLVIGPAFEFMDYRRAASGEVKCPNPVLPSLWRLLQGLLLFVLHNVANMYFPAYGLLTSKNFLTSGSVLVRAGSVWLALIGYRFKYYFGWKIAEGAAVMSGLGFNGIDKPTGKPRFDRVENVDVLGFELSQSLRDSSTAWNKTTNLWLRYYVYERVPAPWNLYVTYFVSAFWHGFYPGYYLFFLSAALGTQVHRNFRRSVRPYFMAADGKTPGPLKWAYDVFSLLAANMFTNYFITSFVVLSFDQTMAVFRSFHFAGHIVLAVMFVTIGLGLVRIPQKKIATKAQ